MKQLFALSVALFLSFNPLKGSAQTIVSTAGHMVLVYDFVGNHFYVDVPCGRKEQVSEDGQYNIDGEPMQFLIFQHKLLPGTDSNALSLRYLNQFFTLQAQHLQEQYKQPIVVQRGDTVLNNGNPLLYIWFENPTAKGREDSDIPTYQLYAAVNIGDRIFGIYSPVFLNMSLAERKAYLKVIMNTIVRSEGIIDAKAVHDKFSVH
jgi:hypothetical protein